MENATPAPAGRKRKLQIEESELSTSSVHLKTRRLSPENSESSSATSTCDHVSPSSTSSELTRSQFADLEEIPGAAAAGEFLRTSSGDSERSEMESTPPDSGHRTATAVKTPAKAELEEFFAAAEKNIQKQFIDRYNFDIVKDQPVEGRYEWVPLRLNQ